MAFLSQSSNGDKAVESLYDMFAVGAAWQWVPPSQASPLQVGQAQLDTPVEGGAVQCLLPALSSFLFAT